MSQLSKTIELLNSVNFKVKSDHPLLPLISHEYDSEDFGSAQHLIENLLNDVYGNETINLLKNAIKKFDNSRDDMDRVYNANELASPQFLYWYIKDCNITSEKINLKDVMSDKYRMTIRKDQIDVYNDIYYYIHQ